MTEYTGWNSYVEWNYAEIECVVPVGDGTELCGMVLHGYDAMADHVLLHHSVNDIVDTLVAFMGADEEE